MTEAEQEIPWLHLDLLTARFTGAQLITTPEQAQALAQATGTEVQPDTEHALGNYRTTLEEPFTQLEAEEDGTNLILQIYDEDGSLDEEFQWAAKLITSALEISGASENIEAFRIRLCMNTDRLPPNEPEVQEKPLSRTCQTHNGTVFQHLITWQKDHDISEETGEDCFSYWADAVTSHVPKEEELVHLLKATYSAAALPIFGDLLKDHA